MKLTGSQIFVEVLVEQGVDTLFGYPGGAVLNLYDELYKANRKRGGSASLRAGHARPLQGGKKEGYLSHERQIPFFYFAHR